MSNFKDLLEELLDEGRRMDDLKKGAKQIKTGLKRGKDSDHHTWVDKNLGDEKSFKRIGGVAAHATSAINKTVKKNRKIKTDQERKDSLKSGVKNIKKAFKR